MLAPFPLGAPCWVEIPTIDLTTTMRFYEAVFGWRYEFRDDNDKTDYVIATVDGVPVAGLRHSPNLALQWNLYFATPDMTSTLSTAGRLGARITESGHVVPGVGTKSLVNAPDAAPIGVCEPSTDWDFQAGEPASLGWAEYVTHQPHHANRFLSHLFEFTQKQFDYGDQVKYRVFHSEGNSVLATVGMDRNTPRQVPPRWIAHFGAPSDRDFTETVRIACSSGGRLRFKPYSSPLGRVAVLSDPLGTRFAVMDPAPAMGSGDDDEDD